MGRWISGFTLWALCGKGERLIQRLLRWLVRGVEQLGRAQTQALGGEALPHSSMDSQAIWRELRPSFDPARWTEPFANHQRGPCVWQIEGWEIRAVGQTQIGWGRSRNRENLSLCEDASLATLASAKMGQGSDGKAAAVALHHFVRALLMLVLFAFTKMTFKTFRQDIGRSARGVVNFCSMRGYTQRLASARSRLDHTGLVIRSAF